MTIDEYKVYYIDFVQDILGPAVKRANGDLKLQADPARQARYENLKNGLLILGMVSFIESNFLQRAQIKSLRKFEPCLPPLPAKVNATHVSCYLYIRDCVAHDPSAKLLPPGLNTTGFCAAVNSCAFPWVLSAM